jgi:hypothetical protein
MVMLRRWLGEEKARRGKRERKKGEVKRKFVNLLLDFGLVSRIKTLTPFVLLAAALRLPLLLRHHHRRSSCPVVRISGYHR